MTMKKAFRTGLGICMGVGLTMSAAVAEEPAFKWSWQVLTLIKSGDKAKGAEVADEHRCHKCHGDAGISDEADTPSIAGQVPAYQFKQLMDYKNGSRSERQMEKIAKKQKELAKLESKQMDLMEDQQKTSKKIDKAGDDAPDALEDIGDLQAKKEAIDAVMESLKVKLASIR